MNTYSCGCLNVHIKTKMVQLDAPDQPEGCHDFFDMKLTRAQLDLGGINIFYDSFINIETLPSWRIYECLSCGLKTHAVSNEPECDFVFINNQMICDPNEIAALKKHDDYSVVYKIILKGPNNNSATETIEFSDLDSEQYNSVTTMQNTIRDRSQEYFAHEKEGTENKIRAYQEEQQSKLQMIERKIMNERSMMMAMIRKHCIEPAAQKLQNMKINSPKAVRVEERRNDSLVDSVDTGVVASGIPYHSPRNIKKLTPNMKKHKAEKAPRVDDFEFDDDIMFGDDDENNDAPFDDSEDDDNDTSSTDDSAFSSRKIYSASVPKHITNIRDRRSMHLDEDSDDEYDPEMYRQNMASSIQQMAQSARLNDTDVFGPRPSKKVFARPT